MEHKKLEEILHDFLQLPKTGEERTDVAIPRTCPSPACDNVLIYKPLCIPEATFPTSAKRYCLGRASSLSQQYFSSPSGQQYLSESTMDAA
jgi:hypothetical protein